MGPLNYCKIYHQNKMKLLLSIFLIGAVFAAPAPQDEDVAIEAVPYVHNEIEAEPYVHDEPLDTHDIVAEPYVHEEPTAAVATAVVPATYAAYPLTYSLPAVSAPAVYKVASAPQTYAIAAPYYVAAVKTGCINNVGSVVPCAQ